MEIELKEFEAEIKEVHRECLSKEIASEPYYRKDIDSLYFFMNNGPSFRKRVNRLLTVFVSSDDGEIAGIEIKGFGRVLENMRRFGIDHIMQNHPTIGLLLCMVVTSPEDGKEWSDGELIGLDKYSDVSLPKGILQPA